MRRDEYGIELPDISWNMTADYLKCVLQVPLSLNIPSCNPNCNAVLEASTKAIQCGLGLTAPAERPPKEAYNFLPIPTPRSAERCQMSEEELQAYWKNVGSRIQDEQLARASTRCSTSAYVVPEIVWKSYSNKYYPTGNVLAERLNLQQPSSIGSSFGRSFGRESNGRHSLDPTSVGNGTSCSSCITPHYLRA